MQLEIIKSKGLAHNSYFFFGEGEAAETKTDLVQRLRRDLKWEINEILPLLQKLLNETLTRLNSDLRWER